MTTSTEKISRPSWRFITSHIAFFAAFGFGAGLVRILPGTVGTLVAFPLFWYFHPILGPLYFSLLILALFLFGIWACEKTGRALGVSDHSGIVWDEVVAFLLVLLFTPTTIAWQLLAFFLFRLFDIVKPPPIRYVDRNLHGGFGVMFDDILAAVYALVCVALIKALYVA